MCDDHQVNGIITADQARRWVRTGGRRVLERLAEMPAAQPSPGRFAKGGLVLPDPAPDPRARVTDFPRATVITERRYGHRFPLGALVVLTEEYPGTPDARAFRAERPGRPEEFWIVTDREVIHG